MKKYFIVICNGLSDEPFAEKDNLTPLQMADIPNFDRLASEGRCGSVQTIPDGLAVGEEISYLSLLGFDSEKYQAGTGNYLARALDLELNSGEIALVCDFVILQSSHNDMIMKDYTAGQISSEVAESLLKALNEQIVDENLTFHYGAGHQHLLVLKHSPFKGKLIPPNELIGEGIRQYMPQGLEYKELVYIMNQAQIILHHHPYNKKRMQDGKDAINSIWIWGEGEEPSEPLPSFFSRFEKRGCIITASLVMKGLGKTVGLEVKTVEQGTGYIDSDIETKTQAAIKALKDHDVVFLHIAGGEHVSLQGNIDDKIQMIEEIDQKVLGSIFEFIETRRDVNLLLVEPHRSSANLMKYNNVAVPFVTFNSENKPDSVEKFDEEILRTGSNHLKNGTNLIEEFLKNTL